jgi:peptidoglycan/LPS O-acetylase OafA/YrhL
MMKLASTKILGLDGIRAMSVAAVVWHHASQGHGWRNGFLGVDVFFVLSGYLITSLLLNEMVRKGDVSLKNFYIRRSLRIFPLYFLVLGLLSAYFLFSKHSQQATRFFEELPFHALYVSNWMHSNSMLGITWSLSTEEQFYFVWPPLLVFLGKRWSLLALAAFLAINQLLNFGIFDAFLNELNPGLRSLHILEITFTPIILGALLAICLSDRARALSLGAVLTPIATVVACVCMVAIAAMPGDLAGLPRLAFQTSALAVLAGVVLHQRSGLVGVLEIAPLRFIGKISYGVYLLHIIGLDLAVRLTGALDGPVALWLRFALCSVLTVLMAWGSFHWFEARFTRLKANFA